MLSIRTCYGGGKNSQNLPEYLDYNDENEGVTDANYSESQEERSVRSTKKSHCVLESQVFTRGVTRERRALTDISHKGETSNVIEVDFPQPCNKASPQGKRKRRLLASPLKNEAQLFPSNSLNQWSSIEPSYSNSKIFQPAFASQKKNSSYKSFNQLFAVAEQALSVKNSQPFSQIQVQRRNSKSPAQQQFIKSQQIIDKQQQIRPFILVKDDDDKNTGSMIIEDHSNRGQLQYRQEESNQSDVKDKTNYNDSIEFQAMKLAFTSLQKRFEELNSLVQTEGLATDLKNELRQLKEEQVKLKEELKSSQLNEQTLKQTLLQQQDAIRFLSKEIKPSKDVSEKPAGESQILSERLEEHQKAMSRKNEQLTDALKELERLLIEKTDLEEQLNKQRSYCEEMTLHFQQDLQLVELAVKEECFQRVQESIAQLTAPLIAENKMLRTELEKSLQQSKMINSNQLVFDSTTAAATSTRQNTIGLSQTSQTFSTKLSPFNKTTASSSLSNQLEASEWQSISRTTPHTRHQIRLTLPDTHEDDRLMSAPKIFLNESSSMSSMLMADSPKHSYVFEKYLEASLLSNSNNNNNISYSQNMNVNPNWAVSTTSEESLNDQAEQQFRPPNFFVSRGEPAPTKKPRIPMLDLEGITQKPH